MRSPHPGRHARWGVLVAVLALLTGHGCGGERPDARTEATAADSAAYSAAVGIEDAAARFAALDDFVAKHPALPLAGDAYPRLISLAGEHAPGRVVELLERFAATDFAAPGPYNAVGWDLAEAGEHLDLAVPILEKAVAKARLGDDADMLASCLDSEAWARYKAGDAHAAVAPMEEARGLIEKPIDELEEHMAEIYDAAGMPEKARPIYVALLSHMEDPEIRERLHRAAAAMGESIEAIEAEIDRRRVEGRVPAPDFTLPGQEEGTSFSLADYRGKVVLLNFWHYT